MKDSIVRRRIVMLTAALVVALLGMPHAAGVGGPQAGTVLVNGHEAVAGEALVKFRTPPVPGDVEQAVDADRNEGVGTAGVRRIHSRSLGAGALVAALAHRPEVEYAEPNYILHGDVIPNDTYFGLLWGLVNTGQTVNNTAGTPGADISADQAWDLTTGSKANVVTVIDSGIDYTHPDLAANVWSAPSSFTVTIGGQTITCAAGTHGFNAIANTCDPMDDNNHGSHVSGTIGAVGNNGTGVTGVNWVASIMGSKFLDKQGSGTTSNAINAIAFAIQAKQHFGAQANVRVLSNSWGGGGYSQALLDEINAAGSNEMLFVAAAGNNGTNNDTTPSYPASYAASNLVAVAATDSKDGLASFSNYGASSVDLGAPGVNIASTVPGGYAYMSGTSMATPHVSGAAALVLAYCPGLGTSQLISTILNSVDPVASLAGKTVTGGRLNAYRALTSCGSGTPPPPAAPDFSLSASPTSITIRRGNSGTVTVAINRTGGFSSDVALSATTPSGVSAAFSPNPASGSSSVLTLSVASGTAKGTSSVIVTGTGGGLSRTVTVQLKVR